ncbi:carnitine O-palmitoyltransferase 2 [Strigomonas culicis]|uniref:Carnitine O-palmitoyltransferase 2 n=1 Tax=Strigomonas culicis TaxID=28005 RepID=S9VNG6_9TRYP|nr:carnitine O-palmitoyltransferase 2 [Strigomonas culicis]|eukprot:EPY24810.1 carnitine O-palmitoyltransferase 2 [Strigomonas culicis]
MYLENALRPDIHYPVSTRGYWTSDWFERSVALCPEYVSTPVITAGSSRNALPLDLSQNDNLFNSTRVPGVLQDEIRAVGFMPHITVLYRGHPFIVTVADSEANVLPLDQIYARLRAICCHGVASAAEEVGLLTSLPRTEWSTWRTSLLRDPGNQRNLEEIETSMFVLCLDNSRDTDVLCAAGAVDKSVAVRQQNCWWDKSILVSVWNRGLSVGYEHGWCDGRIVHRYIDMVNADSARCRASAVPRRSAATEPVRHLTWRLSPEQKDAVRRARVALQTMVDRLDTHHVVLSGLQGCARADVPALLQLAVQLAWWRLQQSAVSTTEDVNMSMFLRGRESAVRAPSAACEAFVLSMHPHNRSHTAAQQAALLREAVKVYARRKALTLSGGGTDPHLFGLHNMMVRLYGREAALFQDAAYRQHQAPTLSTEPPVDAGALLMSSPLPTPTGYGVRQRLFDGETLLTSVSCWRDAQGPRHSASDFADAFASAMEEIVRLRKL